VLIIIIINRKEYISIIFRLLILMDKTHIGNIFYFIGNNNRRNERRLPKRIMKIVGNFCDPSFHCARHFIRYCGHAAL